MAHRCITPSPRGPSMRTSLSLLAALVLAPQAASAQWSVSPDGHNQYAFNYATSIRMSCGPDWIGCTSNPNIVTFHSETGSLTFTFTGTSGVFVAGNQGLPMELGTLHVREEGSYVFPSLGHPNEIIFAFTVTLNSAVPIPVTP